MDKYGQLMNWLIATDLDGTLLNDEYPVEAAAAAVDGLFGLPALADGSVTLQVALATSKTLAECVRFADRCANRPIIAFENGAGLAWPTAACKGRYEFACAGMDYSRIRERLQRLRAIPDYRFRGFGDMSAAEVAQRTGLDEESVADAMLRKASEPLVWEGSHRALRSFAKDLNVLGLDLELGGRFHHVTGRSSKADAVAVIGQRLAGQRGAMATLACGDAPNDVDMMRAADCALVFPGRNGGYVLPEGPKVTHARGAGPDIWSEHVSLLIQSNSLEVDCE
ncbi:MAG: HAD-IIB family hydrolase [Gammaproteobacteria bacterium]|nr:HAD-IIB family hydrolase [Gammaproteobacteria bacterium]MYK28376.1 HAD-IIB family hydrolase [Gammaproteobacteria bacterium]MYK82039.1 HAD-IIB family hydrolase [Gammaproteobacteria bacterium]